MGDLSQPSVLYGNKMVSRQVLALYLCVALGGVYLLEQPGTSLMIEHDRFLGFRDHLTVVSAWWWMNMFGS